MDVLEGKVEVEELTKEQVDEIFGVPPKEDVIYSKYSPMPDISTGVVGSLGKIKNEDFSFNIGSRRF